MEQISNMADTGIGAGKSGSSTNVNRRRINQLILLGAAAIILHAVLNQSIASAPDLLKVGDRIPEFSITTADGGQSGSKELSGKPALIYFFADWCPCSHESIEHVLHANDAFGPKGLGILAVGIQDSTKNLTAYSTRYSPPFPVGVSDGDDAARSMGVKTTPTTLMVGSDGKIKAIHTGKIEKYADIEPALKKIFDEGGA